MTRRHSDPAAKIALFRSLFRGRADVYPRRFESRRTGKSGYAPACANEWVRAVCDKRTTPCARCPNWGFLPVTDEVIRQHLTGQDDQGREFVMGVYPMLLDETCFLLAADFDKESWMEDAAAVRETCREADVPCLLERSRSGNGAHLWLFFEEAVPAAIARKLGAALLTETMERRPEIGLKSYDRFFPNQDTLPKGQFGNLIALPLQKKPRESGNSVFLDDSMIPHADPWACLAAAGRVSRSEAERIVRSAEAARGHVVGVRLVPWDETADEPWTAPPSRRPAIRPIAGPLPESLEIVLGNDLFIAKAGLPPALRDRLIRLAAFQNPEFYRAQAMRLPTFVHAARRVRPDQEGEARARSATEAFLFRRLETLPETAGRFRLNAVLPIPFDQRGQMEADLLCAEARLAVELDGPQHLSDPDAYRRDRHKDVLLQEHGHVVLRFLAEDVGKRLDLVLDTILRALAHRAGRRFDPAAVAGTPLSAVPSTTQAGKKR